MDRPHILHILSPLKHVSPFDVNMALDAGFTSVVPYTHVELGDVQGLVRDAIFSRGAKGVRRTGVFIGGHNAGLALDMLEAARNAMFPPFQLSLFADPSGAFTTAAAMVAKVEKTLKETTKAGLSGRSVAIFGATGVVGYAAGIIAGGEGAQVTLVGYDGAARVKQASEDAKARFDVDLAYGDGSSDALKGGIARDAEVILCAGRAGVEVLSSDHLSGADRLLVAADINAVPPPGIQGVEVQADGAPLAGTPGVGIGAMAVGGVKYQVESGLFRRMIGSDRPLALDFRDAFQAARDLLG
ncbi:MAG: NAD(P)-dependent methylenetetrahydromethanopterin dehydrogenase [Planctomycetota bacterium]|jgi:methylene-tetrahydromethanopterin dehydrogenase